MTLHKSRATLPSAQLQISLPSIVSSQILFIGQPFVRLRVLLFLTSLDCSISKESMPLSFSSMYIVEVTECRRPSGSVLLVFSSGIRHVMLTAILTADSVSHYIDSG
jgi:hypothetical protein